MTLGSIRLMGTNRMRGLPVGQQSLGGGGPPGSSGVLPDCLRLDTWTGHDALLPGSGPVRIPVAERSGSRSRAGRFLNRNPNSYCAGPRYVLSICASPVCSRSPLVGLPALPLCPMVLVRVPRALQLPELNGPTSLHGDLPIDGSRMSNIYDSVQPALGTETRSLTLPC